MPPRIVSLHDRDFSLKGVNCYVVRGKFPNEEYLLRNGDWVKFSLPYDGYPPTNPLSAYYESHSDAERAINAANRN